jgi:hypothetical protein
MEFGIFVCSRLRLALTGAIEVFLGLYKQGINGDWANGIN